MFKRGDLKVVSGQVIQFFFCHESRKWEAGGEPEEQMIQDVISERAQDLLTYSIALASFAKQYDRKS